jgi:DNA-binding NarL/FixJ family response regulator
MIDNGDSIPASTSLDRAGCVPRVLLAGSFTYFSDRVVALLRTEFPSFEFQRVDEAALDGVAQLTDVHLLICEEGIAFRRPGLGNLGRVPLAIAFQEAPSIAARCAKLGLDGLPESLSLLPMNVRIDAWLSIVKLLLHGEAYVPVDVLRSLNSRQDTRVPMVGATPPDAEALARRNPVLRNLTRRERNILLLIAQGKQNKTIAEELDLSEHTVKLHVHHVIAKLGVRNRTEAAGCYLSQASLQGSA